MQNLIQSFEEYRKSKPEYYVGLDKYSIEHDLHVWLDAIKWQTGENYDSLEDKISHLNDLTYELEQNYLVEKEKNLKLISAVKYALGVLNSGLPISPNKDTHDILKKAIE
jgi:hypothetical protein